MACWVGIKGGCGNVSWETEGYTISGMYVAHNTQTQTHKQHTQQQE